MAEATAVLIMEARDRASAAVKQLAALLGDTGQQADKAAAGVAKAGKATDGMLARLKAAQAPLRQMSAVLSGFGLSFIGISAATFALRGLVNAAIQNQQAILAAQINMRRWGLTLDDTRRLTQEFSATLGRTSGTTLAAFTEDMARFLLSFGPEGRADILKWAKQIEVASGGLYTADKVVKDLQEDMELLGRDKALENLKTRAGEATASMGNTAASIYRAKENLATFGDQLSTVLTLFDSESWKQAGEFLKGPFIAFGNWVENSEEWLKEKIDIGLRAAAGFIGENAAALFQGLIWPFVSLSDVLPGLLESIITQAAKLWGGFLGFWIATGRQIIDWAVSQWTQFGEWWTAFVSGIGDFWAGVWNGMRVVALNIYNWIIDRLNDAIAFVNSAIRAINSAMGRVGLRIPEIGVSFQRGTLGESISAPPTGTFSAPVLAASGPSTIIIPVTIGDRPISEIIIDTLTGAVRQRELGGEG